MELRPKFLVSALGVGSATVAYFSLLRYVDRVRYDGAWGSYWLRATWVDWRITPWAQVYLAVGVLIAIVALASAVWGTARASTIGGMVGAYLSIVGVTMLAVPRFQVLATRADEGTSESFMIGIRHNPDTNFGVLLLAMCVLLLAVFAGLGHIVGQSKNRHLS